MSTSDLFSDPARLELGDAQVVNTRSGALAATPIGCIPIGLLDGYYSGAPAEDFARRELRRQHPPATPEEEFPEEGKE